MGRGRGGVETGRVEREREGGRRGRRGKRERGEGEGQEG